MTAGDIARGADRFGVSVESFMGDSGRHRTLFEVKRWDKDAIGYTLRRNDLPDGHDLFPRDFNRLKIKPYSETAHEGNLILNTVWTAFFTIYIGSSAVKTKFSATVGRIGVGDSNTAATYTDSALGASTNKLYKFCAAAPTVTTTLATRSLVWVATFQAADAMWAWNEFGIDQGTADSAAVTADFINHAAGIAQGTKGASQVWTATATLTFT